MSATPATVGKYQVLERLAVGGMAELFKARVAGDHGFAKLVVLKKILPHLAIDPQFVQMFFDEARLTASLDHPNIVQVFELGTDADTPYIAMQFVDGVDVLELLRECARTQIRLPAELAALIAREVLDALDYAHTAGGDGGVALGLVHRDISPGNILVSRRGDVKLTDFGIARAAERSHHTEAGILKGKYGYMSPEQVSGGELDGRSDVFSLAIVLVEMVMARRLFSAASDLDVLLMVRAANLERLTRHADEVPADLRTICERALRRRPADRWPTAGAMRDALTAWLQTRERCDARDLAGFLARLQAAPTAPAADDEPSNPATLSGPQTRLGLAHAAAARSVARAEFIAGVGAGVPDAVVEDEGSHGHERDPDHDADLDHEIVIEPASAAPIEPLRSTGSHGSHGSQVSQVSKVAPAPHETGDLRQLSPTRLLHRLARDRATGLLVLEGRAGMLKETYLGDGHPLYVSSNVARERLGEFLVSHGALTAAALDRAVAVMPRFGGRLTDTLVGLGLISPLEAYRLLTAQVTGKLLDVCTWTKGRYRWYPGRDNPFHVQPLHLDALRILATSASALEPAFVDEWAAGHGSLRPRATGAADLDSFGLGEALARVHAMLDGRATIAELAARIRSDDARLNFGRLLYLLIETEQVALDP